MTETKPRQKPISLGRTVMQKLVAPVLVAAVTAGGFSLQLEYERGQAKDLVGKVTLMFVRACPPVAP